MRAADLWVLAGTLVAFVAFGLWRSRGTRGLPDYLASGRSLPWPLVTLTVMATQASAVTFLATPGQGYAFGLSFVQFYFGLPLAMVVVCVAAIPRFRRLGVYTAYEYLESRFDGRTRTLTAALFLLQRGLAAGITLYAPALVLSVVFGWPLGPTCLVLGALVVATTTLGGARAVSHTHALQFSIIMITMVVAFAMIVMRLPAGIGPGDALAVAGRLGRMNALDTQFDPASRYNLWSGLIGGFFLQLSYFGTDQSQVGRYLGGASIAQSRLGLLMNGLVKIPMQFFILLLGVMVFVFFVFSPAPAFFNPAQVAAMHASPYAEAWRFREYHWAQAQLERGRAAQAWLAARDATAPGVRDAAEARLDSAVVRLERERASVVSLLRARDPAADVHDVNYVFLRFVLAQLPVGLVGLVLAAIFAASMNSTSAELNALATTSVVDVARRLPFGPRDDRATLGWSRFVTLFWTAFAVAFAFHANRLGTLVEAVNLLGSLFYGVILGVFLTAFFTRRTRGGDVFAAAIVAEGVVLAVHATGAVPFLWYNPIGALLVPGLALLFSLRHAGRRA